ncbi:uncharacterized protein FTOL_12100 [Fusarium torulosum]|uniref:Chromo domain-containing protein n=1 Tax=Fusarium torulosum TaxID=33205 RepID=A0AAE8MJZ7_9HYPO|nr:uncharacterized protein FTOL_12100 [Fusarium torulosum]
MTTTQLSIINPPPQGCPVRLASTVTDIESQVDNRLRFQDGINIHISCHQVDRRTARVYLWVTWQMDEGGPRCTSRYDEDDIQDVDPGLLYAYWKEKGGRYEATRLDVYHVYAILDQHYGSYLVQWIGFDETELTWETTRKINNICPAAVIEWKRCKTT